MNFLLNGRSSVLHYSIEYSNENSYLVVNLDEEPQEILLLTHELTFGTRTYLTCPCGKRVNTLYLKGTFFACRKCQNLRYQFLLKSTTRANTECSYRQSQRLKLIDMRADIRRIFYRSQYTKRFERLETMRSSWIR